MIARLIAWSARNLLLVLFGTGFAAAAGAETARPDRAAVGILEICQDCALSVATGIARLRK